MTKAELIKRMAEKSGVSKKETEASLKAFMETVIETIKEGDKIQLVGFGTFEPRQRSAREGKNPQTKEPMHIEASKSVGFRASKSFKEVLNK